MSNYVVSPELMRLINVWHEELKGEKSMNDIKWKVEQINVDSGIYDCELLVEISGMFTNDSAFRKPITFDGLAKEIEHRLNDDPYRSVTDMDVNSMYPDPEKLYICPARHNGKTQLQREFLEDLMKRGGINGRYGITCNYHPEIKDVIFNDPATIVFWNDGTKTVVKCQEGDEFDPEKGLTMAIVKKVYGNKGSYCNEIKKWCEPYYEKQKEKNDLVARICDLGKKATAALAALNMAETAIVNAKEHEEKKYRDFYKYDDPIFETKEDAEKCLENLKDITDKYGCTTIADLYDVAGVDIDKYYTMNKYGWTNLNHVKIHQTRHGYVIDLPKALLIDTGESNL